MQRTRKSAPLDSGARALDKRVQEEIENRSKSEVAATITGLHPLAPTGLAGFVLANGSMSSNQSGEGDIRYDLAINTVKQQTICGNLCVHVI